jgi:hypothetical protein
LSRAAGSIKKILDVQDGSSVGGSLQQIFSDANQTMDRCVIQLSETSFGSVIGDFDTRLDFGIRQLWLAAFRQYKELPADMQKSDLLALPRTQADQASLHEFASLASRLGFESDKIRDILKTPSDRSIAEHALFRARRPGRYVFRDPEKCIQQILDAFAAGVQASTSDTLHETADDIIKPENPPKRHGTPRQVDYEYDKTRLFLPQMQDELSGEMGAMTSTFVRWSVYNAYFGTPPSLGRVDVEIWTGGDVTMAGSSPFEQREPVDDNVRLPVMAEDDVILAITRQELQLERAKHHDITIQLQNKQTKLNKMTQDEASRQKQLQDIHQQIRDQNAQLEKLRQEMEAEQERLNRFKEMADTEQGRVGEQEQEEQGGEFAGQLGTEDDRTTLTAREPTTETASEASRQPTPAASKSQDETQVLLRRTNRHTRFNFRELLAHNPDKEHQEMLASEVGADGREPKRTIRIDFAHAESADDFVICDVVEVDPTNPEDVSQVVRVATKYRRKGFYLYDKERNQLNATDCFQKVVDDGTYTIVVERISGTEDSGRAKRRMFSDEDSDRIH